jgi:hypothetical protein
MKPYPNEHSCRIRNPADFEADSFRRIKQGRLHMIIGKLKGESKTTLQAFRYPKADWGADEARAHCKKQGGSFEAAAKKTLSKEQLAIIEDAITKGKELHDQLGKAVVVSQIQDFKEQVANAEIWVYDDLGNVIEIIKQRIKKMLAGLRKK